ncbi:hypothetical protein GOQ27_08550 [Clostridium sp. D2Q-11]|uniref:DUF4367 domain-containing protein n=1 Tax=Anaeromonas frigoriresistens TaxID=2683708 RepID=A0A942UZN8_9FIRM|nr:hypothetical protein [Anaeromonas frigoriresistens]MBS4538512.1 hypothetical protein [Anaeromonas frigoriresistens]
MINKSNLESMIKKDLIQKASEVKPSDEMISKIIDRIEDEERTNHNMLKDRILNVILRRFIAVSLCGVLAFTGILFIFSETARALTLDAVNTIKTIFVLEKSEGDYKIVEQSTTDPVFTPVCIRTSKLSDEEISKKLKFNVSYPESLSGGYKYHYKSEGVGIQRQVSQEKWRQLQVDMIEAINDETALNGLSAYKPYRIIVATYRNKEGHNIFIQMQAAEVLVSTENNSTVVKTNIGNEDAIWIEMMTPEYEHIMENGMGTSNLFKKPERIVKVHSLIWESDGVRYVINTMKGQELFMEESVKIAESFMEQIK